MPPLEPCADRSRRRASRARRGWRAAAATCSSCEDIDVRLAQLRASASRASSGCASSIPLMNFTDFLGAERARQLERLVDDDRRRRVRRRAAARRPPSAESADRAPPSARAASARAVSAISAIDRVEPRRPCRAPASVANARSVVRRRLARRATACVEERLGRAVDVAAADLPLIEDLQRRFARAVARIFLHARGPRAHASLGRRACRVSCATTVGHLDRRPPPLPTPCCAGPSPARSSASSTEFVVSTPNVIGTPVAAAAAVRPCATADAMYSKCGVSPRIRQPRQTTASKRAALGRVLRRRAESRTRPARARP